MGKKTRVGIDLTPGLTSNDTSYATQSTFRDANNIRFYQKRAEVIKGFEKVITARVSGACRSVLPWKDNQGVPMIAMGTHSNLYVYRSGRLVDITPAGLTPGNIDGSTGVGFGTGSYGSGPFGQFTNLGDYHARTWSLNNFGQSLIANPRSQPIYWWQNDITQPATLLSSVTGAVHVPPAANLTLVTSNRQLLAFGCNEELAADGVTAPGVFNPLCIRGSDLDGKINDWGVSNANNAFEYILPNGGMIMGAKLWSDRIAVWTQSSLYMGTYTGDPDTVYRWDPIDGSLGLLGPNACLIVGQTAFWISPDLQFWMCELGGAPTQIICPIQSDTLAHIPSSQSDKVVMSFYAGKNEIRVDYPDQRDGDENSRFLVFNIDDGAFSKGQQCRSAFMRGTIVEHPVGVDVKTMLLPYTGTITDNASAQTALTTIQANLPAYYGTNLVTQAKASVISGGASTAITSIFTGHSGWGFQMTGDGSTARQGQIGSLGLAIGQKVSISYQAQVVVGPNVNMTVDFRSSGGATVDATDTVAVTYLPQRFKHDNITVQATDDVMNFKFTSLPNGTVVQITDIKIEAREESTLWTPALTDSNLYTNYLTFLQTLTYPQVVGNFYYHEIGDSADEENLDWFIETNDFAMDENMTAVRVMGFVPDFKDQKGVVTLTVFVRTYPKDAEEAYTFTITEDTDHVDFMVTGKLFRFRVEGSSAPASMRLGRCMFDFVPAGTR